MTATNPSIVIGIDFGTTYSGVSWAPAGSYIQTISGWPSGSGPNNDKRKTPSALVYRSEGQPPVWGYRIPYEDVALRWFKLLLLDDEDIPAHVRDSEYLKEARRQLKQNNRHAGEVIADYLRELWKQGLQSIEQSVGKRRVSTSRFELVVTLPAIWPQYARKRMEAAVQSSGLLDYRKQGPTTLTFISEPEAAALATMEDFEGRVEFKKNDHFVVCDAGGGTVDIISYKVIRERPLQLRESVKGDGKLCGSIVLDSRFLALAKTKTWDSPWDQLDGGGAHYIMQHHWENEFKKMSIEEGSFEVTLPIRLPSAKRARPANYKLTFSRDEVRDVYEPVVNEISALVLDQAREVAKMSKKSPTSVVLVGGLGNSQVLYRALAKEIEAEFPLTELLQAQGDRPWTAVCRGAVLRGLARCGPSPDAQEHDVRDKAWCPVSREFLAVDQVKWFIYMGETLSVDSPVVHDFWQDLEEPGDCIETEIVYSTTGDRPSYRFDGTVQHLCTIRWSKIPPFSSLPVWTNAEGKEIRQVCYEVRMVPDGATLDFVIFYDGAMVASKNVDIDCTPRGASRLRRVALSGGRSTTPFSAKRAASRDRDG
ncbi:hypothetical protein CDD83_9820 [Cordyceps sp. RAO-2017]|nr:hypothetical protein CDD83_9820 [Cordyceps sp. RAO-2017]